MANLQEAVRKFASDLAEQVETFVKDVSVLDVRTYTTPHDQVQTFISGQPDVAKAAGEGKIELRAFTQIRLDGDIDICVPQAEDGSVDKGVWDIHTQTVEQAMVNRAKMIETIGNAAAAALKAIQQAQE
ncbi:MAG: hypothetical protein ACP5HM_09215 [Anaerolineae bacterium]